MKRTMTLLALSLAATLAQANDLSVANPVTRSLTLQDNEILLSGGVGYGKTNGDNNTAVMLNAAYGLTDNLTLGAGGVRYNVMPRAYNDTGLEITVDGGLLGVYESEEFGDSYALGGGVTGKYVMSQNLAFTFSGHYLFWNEDERDNRSEVQLSAGTIWRVHEQVSLFANAHYRELKDFAQDNAKGASAGVIYNYSNQTDFTIGVGTSDFDPEKDGYDNDSAFESVVTASMTYRF